MSRKVVNVEVGDIVGLQGLPGRWTVVDTHTRSGQLLVARGHLSVWVAQQKVVSNPPSRKPKTRSLSTAPCNKFSPTDQPKVAQFVLTVDFHSLNRHEALELVEERLSFAILNRVERLDLIHGIGEGIIKTTLHSWLSNCKHVRRFELDQYNPGTTLVWI